MLKRRFAVSRRGGGAPFVNSLSVSSSAAKLPEQTIVAVADDDSELPATTSEQLKGDTLDIADDYSDSAVPEETATAAIPTTFSQIMQNAHKLRTYRQDQESYPTDLPPLHPLQRTLQFRTTVPGHDASPPWQNVTSSSSSSNNSKSKNSHLHRTTNTGTSTQPFISKLHPNFATSDNFCLLCGSYCVGGRDHHMSFDRDHIALSYFFFLVCCMRREWDPRGVLTSAGAEFPVVWRMAVSPPIKFSREYSTLLRLQQLGWAGGTQQAFRQHLPATPEVSGEVNSHECLSMSLGGTNWLVNRVQRLGPLASMLTHDARSAGSRASLYTAVHARSREILAEEDKRTQDTLQSVFLRGLGAPPGMEAREFKRLVLESCSVNNSNNIFAEADKRATSLQNNLASQFSPAWWALRSLHQNRIELQALLATAMGTFATRSVCAQLPPGLIGQGEKTFRADVMRIISSTMPAIGSNVTAALSQKTFGRTNLSRMFDSLAIERLHGSVLGRQDVTPRVGRSEKSAVIRQLITELHIHVARGKGCDDGDSDDASSLLDEHQEFLFPPSAAAAAGSVGSSSAASCSCADLAAQAMLTSQLADMILSRLAAEAVLTMSHIYMDRAWRVAALCGWPSPEELEALDYT